MQKIIDYKWFGSRSIGQRERFNVVSGAVLIFNGFKYRAFIGVGKSGDKDTDVQEIIDYGNEINKEEAVAIFGDVSFIHNSKEYFVSGKEIQAETLKEVMEGFADEHFEGSDPEMKVNWIGYTEDLKTATPEGEQENLMWEAGYLRGYESALRSILTEINNSNNKLITAERIEYLLEN